MDRSDCDVMILISIVTMVMIRNQPWCVTITSFADFWPDFPFFRSAMSVLSPWVTSTGSGMINRSNRIQLSGKCSCKNHCLELANKSDLSNFLISVFLQAKEFSGSQQGRQQLCSKLHFYLPCSVTFTFHLDLFNNFHFSSPE